MDGNVLSALKSIPVAELTRADWILVGMALKEEGYPLSVWDEWSRNDTRYHEGECEKKWAGSRGSSKPVRAGTIVRMAKERGWEPERNAGPLDWNGEISGDRASAPKPDSGKESASVRDFRTFIETLFDPDDRVGYVTGDVFRAKSGKWAPAKGVFTRMAGDLLSSLKEHPERLSGTVGRWNEQAGAWIRINALDGNGVRDENVARFRYALVESDTLPVKEQEEILRKLSLPIATLVYSGGKSLHALVRVDASSEQEYDSRVSFLYRYLEGQGLEIDRQNRNPSRLSRMPGVTRNGKYQSLVAVNIGKPSWDEWVRYVEASADGLPEIDRLSEFKDHPPDLPDELIEGILRRGHKMLVSGSSKAGKSFLLMELAAAIAEGKKWLGFQCRKGKVLYVNLEIDAPSAINRFLKIYRALGIPMAHSDDIEIWNLRGHAVPLDLLVPKLVSRVKDEKLDAVIIDPIYKVITGDENSASDMGRFCNQFDRLCNELGCAVIYCHHHSKAANGSMRAINRASGSGVFSRDPDAQLDMIELELPEDIKRIPGNERATAWRMESSLREFPNIRPVNFWFRYPVHEVDSEGILQDMPEIGSFRAGRMKNPRAKTAAQAGSEFRAAFDAVSSSGSASVEELGKFLKVSDKTVYARIRKMDGEFALKNKRVYRTGKPLEETQKFSS